MPILSDLIGQHELLELNLFEDIGHAQLLATQWQWAYNNIRPHLRLAGFRLDNCYNKEAH
jgi:transposase InsO family protein